MNYEELINNGCTLVCGGTKEERDRFEKELLTEHPSFETGIYPDFIKDKKPFFGKPLSALKVMLKHPGAKAAGTDKIMEMSKNIFLYTLMDRTPGKLLDSQRFRFSLLLGVLEEKKTFFLRSDDEAAENETINAVLWIKENLPDAQIIWLVKTTDKDALNRSQRKIAVPYFLKNKPTMMTVADRILDISEVM